MKTHRFSRNHRRPARTVPARTAAALLCVLALAAGCDPGSPASESGEAPPDDAVRFTRVTDEAGLGAFRNVTGAFGEQWFPETVGGGVGVIDYDDDGWADLALVGGGTWPGRDDPPARAVWLFRNQRDGTFVDVTASTGLDSLRAYGQGLTVADYDNDGDEDLFLTTVGRNLLLRNEPGEDASGNSRRFVEAGREAGLAGEAHWSTSALFFDADRDGHLDLYVGNYVEWSPETDIWCTIDGETKAYCTPQLYTGTPGDFYHNNGDGTFTNRTDEAGFSASPGKTLGVAEWDFNRDGWPDLVVANDTQRDLLFMNEGNSGTRPGQGPLFTERGVASGIAFDENGRSRAGMGIDVGVVDASDRPAVVVGHFSNEMIGVYLQVGPGIFIDQASQSRIGWPSLPTLTFGLLLVDPDLDGDLDVFAANGHIDEDAGAGQEGISYRQYPQLFINLGDGRFEDHGPPVDLQIVARALASADYDHDGDEDLIVTENGGPVHLLRNDHPGGGFVRVLLEGRDGNRDALGAHVVASVDGRRLHRRMRTGSGFLSSSEKALTFGLGGASRVDSLTVEWPRGGVDVFTDLPSGQEVRIVEGTGIASRELPEALPARE